MVLTRYYHGHASKIPSAEQARIALGYWSDFFPRTTISDLTPERQEAFVAWLRARGCSDGYTSRVLSVGRAALNRAWKRQEIRTVPFVMSLPKAPPRERRLSLDEAAALFEAAEPEHLFMYLMVAFNTLARPQAILELRRFQIDLNDRLIEFNPPGRHQTKKYRPSVPISGTLLPWLRQVKTETVVAWHGRPLDSIKTAFRKARQRAGLSGDVIPYTVRHTMATELRRRAVSMEEISGMLGHKTGGVTEVYAKYAPDFMGQAVEAIDAYFADLQARCRRLLVLPSTTVRANCVSVPTGQNLQVIENMVGAAGIEPATPTMST